MKRGLVLGAVLALAGGCVSVAEAPERAPLEVVEHHIAALKANDVEALMSDYAEDAVVVIELGAFRGHEELRGLFTMITDPVTRPEIVYMTASPFGDTPDIIEEVFKLDFGDGREMDEHRELFVVRGGKIVFQTKRADVPR